MVTETAVANALRAAAEWNPKDFLLVVNQDSEMFGVRLHSITRVGTEVVIRLDNGQDFIADIKEV